MTSSQSRGVLLEVPVASVEDALAAQEGGADRLELNAALSLGGLTPSLGTLIEVKAAVALPVLVMIRPRPGGFAYGEADFKVMQRDVDPEPFEAMEQLIELGFRRVMTSGQEETAYNGAKLIAELIQRAVGRIEVLPAGGINRFTVADVVARTGCDHVHASLRRKREDRSVSAHPHVSFGGAVKLPEDRYDATSAEAVAELRGLLLR
jgi:copper homeostasis protein